jgi:hypothetical protein
MERCRGHSAAILSRGVCNFVAGTVPEPDIRQEGSKMENAAIRRLASLLCILIAGLAAPRAKTLLVIPLKMDSTKIKDHAVIREMYAEALGSFHSGTVKTAKAGGEPCAEKQCALDTLKAQGGDEAVFGAVRILGSKIFLSSSIVGADGAIFSQQLPVANVEDFEAATKRMADAIVNRKTLEETANVDNITEKEEDPAMNRRKSFYSMGGSAGFTAPFGSSYRRWARNTSDPCSFGGCTDATHLEKNDPIFTLGWNNWFEFRNHLAIEMDFLVYAPIAIGGDINLEYMLGDGDFTPFVGGGLGAHYVFPDEGDHEDAGKRNFGPAANFQAGLILFRTYNMNLVVRGSYHVVGNDDTDYGATVDVAVRTRLGGSGGGDKYHHTSATTYLGMAIGVAYLVAIIVGAANQ